MLLTFYCIVGEFGREKFGREKFGRMNIQYFYML